MKIINCILTILPILCIDASAQSGKIERFTYKVEETLPHDVSSYTQGLFFVNGQLYESAGQYGTSSFRKVELKSGNVLKRINFSKKYFIEGSCVLKDRLYILTWNEHTCFVYDINSFKMIGTTSYIESGWGLTTDGKSLIMSDGTSTIRFRNPDNFAVEREITVRNGTKKIEYLNELEYIKGEIWANIYGSDIIVRIDPVTGGVKSTVDCTNILPQSQRTSRTDVLNGIAYDEKSDKIYITGKYWPKMYRITLKKK